MSKSTVSADAGTASASSACSPRTSQQRSLTAYRAHDFVPQVGSNRYELQTKWWDGIAARICAICSEGIGYGCWIYEYVPGGQIAHKACVDDVDFKVAQRRENAAMIDAGAKLARLTQAGFRALPTWEKDRILDQVEEANDQGLGRRDETPPRQ